MTTFEGCKGCVCKNSCGQDRKVGYIKDGITYKCPCQTCLIKGICKNSCGDFNKYIKYLPCCGHLKYYLED